jgi:hypothetical protein
MKEKKNTINGKPYDLSSVKNQGKSRSTHKNINYSGKSHYDLNSTNRTLSKRSL